MNAVIIDDEILAIEELQRILEGCDSITTIKGFDDAKEGLTYILLKEPDIAFIDISMPYINGTSLAREIAERQLETKVVFVTAHNEYALEAFSIDVFDYVLKPVSEKRINKSIKKVQTYYDRIRVKKQDVKQVEVKMIKEQWALWRNDAVKIVSADRIRFFEVNGKKVTVNTVDGIYEINENLSSVIKQVNQEKFFQCFKSIVVNIAYIDKISPMFNQTYEIILQEDGKVLPVSRHYGMKMKEKFGF